MGDPTRQEPKTPGIPGFAASFASSARHPGDRDTPSVLSRLLTAGLVLALLGAGVFGIGKLMDYQRDRNQAAERAAAATKVVPGPSKAPSGERRAGSLPPVSGGSGKDSGPVRYAPPAYIPHQSMTSPPSSPASSGSDGKAASASPSGGATKETQQQQPSGPQHSAGTTGNGSGDSAFRIMGVDSHRCIDVTDHMDSAPDKTALQIYDCSDNPNQQWTFYEDGTIRSLGMCMSALEGSTADGTAIDVYRCNGSSSQKWRFTTANDLVNVKADKCVDVRDFSTQNGARLQLWPCAGSNNQKWQLA
jgi:hypothetical protein